MGPRSRPKHTITLVHLAQTPQALPTRTTLEPLPKTLKSSVGLRVHQSLPTLPFSRQTSWHWYKGSSPWSCHSSPPFHFLYHCWGGAVVSHTGTIPCSVTHRVSHQHILLMCQASTRHTNGLRFCRHRQRVQWPPPLNLVWHRLLPDRNLHFPLRMHVSQ